MGGERREREREQERERGGEKKRKGEREKKRVKEQNRKTLRGNCGLLVTRKDTKDERRKVKEGEDEESERAQLSRRGRKSIDFAS